MWRSEGVKANFCASERFAVRETLLTEIVIGGKANILGVPAIGRLLDWFLARLGVCSVYSIHINHGEYNVWYRWTVGLGNKLYFLISIYVYCLLINSYKLITWV